MKYRELIKLLSDDGWIIARQSGSHVQFCHPHKQGIVTVAAGGKLSGDVKPGTLNSILKQAGLKK